MTTGSWSYLLMIDNWLLEFPFHDRQLRVGLGLRFQSRARHRNFDSRKIACSRTTSGHPARRFCIFDTFLPSCVTSASTPSAYIVFLSQNQSTFHARATRSSIASAILFKHRIVYMVSSTYWNIQNPFLRFFENHIAPPKTRCAVSSWVLFCLSRSLFHISPYISIIAFVDSWFRSLFLLPVCWIWKLGFHLLADLVQLFGDVSGFSKRMFFDVIFRCTTCLRNGREFS